MKETQLKRKIVMALLSTVCLLALFLAPIHKADAAINSQIHFQGKLTNPDGTNVSNNTYSVVFTIYDGGTEFGGGSNVWAETQSVTVTDGIFNVQLGSVNTTLASAVDFSHSPLYLGIKVAADAEMSPLILFTAAPYAFNSDKLGGISSSGYVQLGQVGSVTNAMLVNSGLTVTAGNGLANGGAVSLGGTTILNIGAGTGITVNADDIAITANGINFTELANTLALDAATTITLGANNFTTNVNSTGTYALQANGNTVLQVLSSGAVSIGNILSDQAIGIDNGTGAINIATDSDANTTNIGTGTAADTVNIGDANANVSLADAQWSISGAGSASFASTSGSGLSDCDQQNSKLLWNISTGLFSCGTDRASVSVRKATSEPIASSAALQDDNELLFAANASETWIYDVSFIYTTGASATPDIRVGMNGPTGSTCVYQASDIAHAGNAAAGATACNASISLTTTSTGTKGGILTGSITTAGTAGNVVFRWAQNTSNATATTVVAGSSIVAFKLTGADYAETYYTSDASIQKGELVELEGSGRSQVKKAGQPYSDRTLGIVSTKPGQVVGEADGQGKPVQIALAGRVPIKLSTENGVPKAGDMVTASATLPGLAMKAVKSGYIVGQLLLNAVDNEDGTADGFVFVRNGYWQAPVTMDLSTVFKSGAATDIATSPDPDIEILGLSSDMAQTYSGFDQSVVDTILKGFTLQQDQITALETRLSSLEQQAGLGALFGDSISSLEDGSLRILNAIQFAGTTYFDNPIVTSENSAGTVKLLEGNSEHSVQFEPEYARIPKVILTPNSFIEGKWRVKNVTKQGFIIELSEPLTEDAEFTWQALSTK